MFIPCMCCGRELPDNWSWWVCDTCGYRVCPSCMNSFKCPQVFLWPFSKEIIVTGEGYSGPAYQMDHLPRKHLNFTSNS
jgi:hypothetical protein